MIASNDRVPATGALYGFENQATRGAAPGTMMDSMATVQAALKDANGALYGFEAGGAPAYGTDLNSANAQPTGALARGELYGFEADRAALGGVSLVNSGVKSSGALAGGALYGFEAQPIGATDLGE